MNVLERLMSNSAIPPTNGLVRNHSTRLIKYLIISQCNFKVHSGAHLNVVYMGHSTVLPQNLKILDIKNSKKL